MKNGQDEANIKMNAAIQAMQVQRDSANNQLVQMAAVHAVEVAGLQAQIEKLKGDEAKAEVETTPPWSEKEEGIS